MASSSSFYKLGSQVLDDFVARNNSTINHAIDEAEQFKKKLLIKKKSIEHSIESFHKNKVKPIDSPGPSAHNQASSLVTSQSVYDVRVSYFILLLTGNWIQSLMNC